MIWLILAAAFIIGFSAFLIWRVFLRERIKDRWNALWYLKLPPKCECCGSWRGLRLESGRTMYPYESDSKDYWVNFGYDPKDPNRSQLLCRLCAVQHHEYWDDMWKEYYSGRL